MVISSGALEDPPSAGLLFEKSNKSSREKEFPVRADHTALPLCSTHARRKGKASKRSPSQYPLEGTQERREVTFLLFRSI